MPGAIDVTFAWDRVGAPSVRLQDRTHSLSCRRLRCAQVDWSEFLWVALVSVPPRGIEDLEVSRPSITRLLKLTAIKIRGDDYELTSLAKRCLRKFTRADLLRVCSETYLAVADILMQLCAVESTKPRAFFRGFTKIFPAVTTVVDVGRRYDVIFTGSTRTLLASIMDAKRYYIDGEESESD